MNFGGFTRLATADAGASDFFAPWCQTAAPGLIGPRVGYEQAPPPAIVAWTADLPEPAIDLTASINPAGTRRALMRHAGSLRLMSWDDTGPRFEAPSVVVGRPVTAVAPALHLAVAGVVRASVLMAHPSNARRVSLTQVTWPTSGSPQVAADAPIERSSPVRSDGRAYVTKRQVMLPPQVLVMKALSYDLEIHARPELNLLQ